MINGIFFSHMRHDNSPQRWNMQFRPAISIGFIFVLEISKSPAFSTVKKYFCRLNKERATEHSKFNCLFCTLYYQHYPYSEQNSLFTLPFPSFQICRGRGFSIRIRKVFRLRMLQLDGVRMRIRQPLYNLNK